MNETGTDGKALRWGLMATLLTPVVVIVYLSAIADATGGGFFLWTGIALVLTLVSLWLSRRAIKMSSQRRLWLWFNVAAAVGFLIVLGILLLNTAVALWRFG